MLNLVLRSLRDWSLVQVAASVYPAPAQQGPKPRGEIHVVSLLGAESYALEVWLAASIDPAFPRLAVLVAPPLPSLVLALLGRALTAVPLQGVVVLLSPGLSLGPVTGLHSASAPPARS